jgi:HEAT repeat protein
VADLRNQGENKEMPNMPNTGQQAAPAKPAEPVKAKPSRAVPPPEFQSEKMLKMNQAELIRILRDPKATAFQKAKAGQFIAPIATKEAVPALAALLADEKLAFYGRYGLETIPDPSVDDALRAALPKLKGNLQVGVIHSIRQRKDPKAVDALTKLIYGNDPVVAKAAASAIGSISGANAAKVLREALTLTKGQLRDVVADAGLVCAEGLLAMGEREQALALYDTLSRTDIPKAQRLAAMQGIIAAEISLSRPRS